MADYITSTSASLHSSPSRKRTRESHTTRTSNNSSPYKTVAASATTNLEVMDSSTSETTTRLPCSTQPQIAINSVRIDHSLELSNEAASNGIAGSTSPTQIQTPITVRITFFCSVQDRECEIYSFLCLFILISWDNLNFANRLNANMHIMFNVYYFLSIYQESQSPESMPTRAILINKILSLINKKDNYKIEKRNIIRQLISCHIILTFSLALLWVFLYFIL